MSDSQLLTAVTHMIAEPRHDGDDNGEGTLVATHPEAATAALDHRLSASTTGRCPVCGIHARPTRSTP